MTLFMDLLNCRPVRHTKTHTQTQNTHTQRDPNKLLCIRLAHAYNSPARLRKSDKTALLLKTPRINFQGQIWDKACRAMCVCAYGCLSGWSLGKVRRCLEQWDGLTSHGVGVAGAGAEARFPKQQSWRNKHKHLKGGGGCGGKDPRLKITTTKRVDLICVDVHWLPWLETSLR